MIHPTWKTQAQLERAYRRPLPVDRLPSSTLRYNVAIMDGEPQPQLERACRRLLSINRLSSTTVRYNTANMEDETRAQLARAQQSECPRKLPYLPNELLIEILTRAMAMPRSVTKVYCFPPGHTYSSVVHRVWQVLFPDEADKDRLDMNNRFLAILFKQYAVQNTFFYSCPSKYMLQNPVSIDSKDTAFDRSTQVFALSIHRLEFDIIHFEEQTFCKECLHFHRHSWLDRLSIYPNVREIIMSFPKLDLPMFYCPDGAIYTTRSTNSHPFSSSRRPHFPRPRKCSHAIMNSEFMRHLLELLEKNVLPRLPSLRTVRIEMRPGHLWKDNRFSTSYYGPDMYEDIPNEYIGSWLVAPKEDEQGSPFVRPKKELVKQWKEAGLQQRKQQLKDSPFADVEDLIAVLRI